MSAEAEKESPGFPSPLEAQLIEDEGYRQFPYQDSVGILTVGHGRNLSTVGIRKGEALWLLRQDIKQAMEDLDHTCPWWRSLSVPRQHALVNMTVNLGIGGLRGFQRMLAALKRRDYAEAAREALDSRWAGQVGERAVRITAAILG